ncbi:hypothetical protein [Candidatus Spongiihabitans sp.]|uniref:hypothetical protein n=1 Tax=Candidatus Spongiihabitans sp. TaxID=3101308 RepID=UPI003C7BBA20
MAWSILVPYGIDTSAIRGGRMARAHGGAGAAMDWMVGQILRRDISASLFGYAHDSTEAGCRIKHKAESSSGYDDKSL